jgi:hypothetical protein
MISDEITDAIASIEMHRQEAAKETSLAAACNEALRKLHELLEHERASQPEGPGERHAANLAALAAAIERVKGLAGAGARPRQGGRPGPRRPAGAAPQHHSPRGKQRRNMGRGRGR